MILTYSTIIFENNKIIIFINKFDFMLLKIMMLIKIKELKYIILTLNT